MTPEPNSSINFTHPEPIAAAIAALWAKKEEVLKLMTGQQKLVEEIDDTIDRLRAYLPAPMFVNATFS